MKIELFLTKYYNTMPANGYFKQFPCDEITSDERCMDVSDISAPSGIFEIINGSNIDLDKVNEFAKLVNELHPTVANSKAFWDDVVSDGIETIDDAIDFVNSATISVLDVDYSQLIPYTHIASDFILNEIWDIDVPETLQEYIDCDKVVNDFTRDCGIITKEVDCVIITARTS